MRVLSEIVRHPRFADILDSSNDSPMLLCKLVGALSYRQPRFSRLDILLLRGSSFAFKCHAIGTCI